MANLITPPPELVQQLRLSSGTWLDQITNAYQAGADQELEACCEYMQHEDFHGFATELRAARRPHTPPSLKEQALTALLHLDQGQHNERCFIIRRALEALPND